MSYELTPILKRCTRDDAKFLITNIDSYAFTDDKGLRELLDAWESGSMPVALAKKLETEIRYLGSSEVAYLARKLRGVEPAGVSVEEMIEDVCKVMKITYKKVGTMEYKLEMLAKGIVEKTFLDKTPEEQIEILQKMNLKDEKIKLIIKQFKEGGAKILPVLMSVLGKQTAMQLVQSVIISVLTVFLGKEAAKQLMKILATKMPWLVLLGPFFVAAMVGWTALDLSGPAMRKTIPLLLHLSVIALRDGAEDEAFWE